jgi:hypothetical protein
MNEENPINCDTCKHKSPYFLDFICFNRWHMMNEFHNYTKGKLYCWEPVDKNFEILFLKD